MIGSRLPQDRFVVLAVLSTRRGRPRAFPLPSLAQLHIDRVPGDYAPKRVTDWQGAQRARAAATAAWSALRLGGLFFSEILSCVDLTLRATVSPLLLAR